MCQSAQQQYVANTGRATVTVANTALDGSGTLNLLLNAGDDGTVVKSITIKSAGSNAQGMVRFFIRDSQGAAMLWKEVPVPAQVQSPTVSGYQTTIRVSMILDAKQQLFVTTQNSEVWNVIAEAVNWTNCPCS